MEIGDGIPRFRLHSSYDDGYLYGEGKELRLASHRPPQPFGSRIYPAPFDKNGRQTSQEDLRSRSPADHVFSLLPRERAEGSAAPDSAHAYLETDDRVSLVVTEELSTNDGIGAQVVLCDVKSGPTSYWNKMGHRGGDHPTQVIAKIYDPLFYKKLHPLGPWIRLDTVSSADGEYSKEAAAYMEFHKAGANDPMVRDFVPRYYGSWTIMVKNEGWGNSGTRPSADSAIRSERPVRVILMEFLDGCHITDICGQLCDRDGWEYLEPPQFADSTKNEERARNMHLRLLRGLTALDYHGIRAEFFNTDSFVLLEEEEEDSAETPAGLQRLGDVRIVMINHDCTSVSRYNVDRLKPKDYLKRPLHPASTEFTPDRMQCLAGWFPLEWLDDNKLFQDWAHKWFRREDFTSEEEADELFDKFMAKDKSPETSKQSPAQAKVSDSSDTGPSGGILSDSDIDYHHLSGSMATLATDLSTSVHSLRPLATVVEAGGGSEGDEGGEDQQKKREAAEQHAAEEELDDADDEDSPESKSSRKSGRGGRRDEE